MCPHPDAPEGLPTPLFLIRTVILSHLCPQKDVGWCYPVGLCRVRVPCASLACWLGCWSETQLLTGRSWKPRFFARQAFSCFLLSEWVMQERETEHQEWWCYIPLERMAQRREEEMLTVVGSSEDQPLHVHKPKVHAQWLWPVSSSLSWEQIPNTFRVLKHSAFMCFLGM